MELESHIFISESGFDMAGYKLDTGVDTKLDMGIGMESSDSVCSKFESCGDGCCPDGDCELSDTLDSQDMEVDIGSVGSEGRPELWGKVDIVGVELIFESDTLDRCSVFELGR